MAARTQKSVSTHRIKLLHKILFSLIVFAFCIGFFEVAARVSYPLWFRGSPDGSHLFEMLISGRLDGTGYFPNYKPHPYTAFTLREGATLIDGEVLHTEDGFRMPFMAKSKPKGIYRIALLGGSTTYDQGCGFLSTSAAYFEEVLQKAFPTKNIEVLNAAISGYTSAESFARFHFNVLDYSPDMVIIYHGVNDVWPRIYSRVFECDYRTARKILKEHHPAYIDEKTKAELDKLALAQQKRVMEQERE